LPVLPDEPVSRTFGFERGKPVDRWYIERFLAEHSADVRGRVLEVAESTYTGWYGGEDVTASDVLYAAEGNPDATVVGDLHADAAGDLRHSCSRRRDQAATGTGRGAARDAPRDQPDQP
jgi:hypothetical protein